MPRMTIDIEADQLSDVMDRIKSWPRTMRIALVKSVLDTLDVPRPSGAARPAGRGIDRPGSWFFPCPRR